jgi:uncharacterized membrane protein
MDRRNPPQVLIHFYRAAVGHADVWRNRLDATTHWAVVTTAAVVTFGFGGRQSPHFVVLMALLFDFLFLYMEARRYQVYHRWMWRLRLLHHFMVVPALRSEEDPSDELIQKRWDALADDLGRTVPRIGLLKALGYRVRRNYGPLITLALMVWVLKLYIHPEAAHSFGEFVSRARVGIVPGAAVLITLGAVLIGLIIMALRAPTERMKDWVTLPSPIGRITKQEGTHY